VNTKDYTRQNNIVKRTFLTVLAVGGALFLVWAVRDYNKRMTTYSCDTAPVTVYRGDTLWQIARQHCWGNLSVAVDDLVEEYGTNLQIGQTIYLKSNS
jgi:hypothetical protein